MVHNILNVCLNDNYECNSFLLFYAFNVKDKKMKIKINYKVRTRRKRRAQYKRRDQDKNVLNKNIRFRFNMYNCLVNFLNSRKKITFMYSKIFFL